jgi:putative ABC transport system permease protein
MAAIVTDGFAKRFGGAAALVGRRMFSPFDAKALTVVGVIPETSYRPGGGGPPEVFVPASMRLPVNLTFVVRVRGNVDAYLPVCRDAIRAVDPQVPVFAAKTMEQRLNESLSAARFYTTAVLFFGCFALLLAIIGIYGVATVSIAQRTHEIGVRLAVGASPDRLRVSLLQQSLLPVAVGTTAGIAGAIGLGQLVRNLIENAEPVGVYPCAFAAVVLAATAAIAIWVASKRIVRLDPNQILRAD